MENHAQNAFTELKKLGVPVIDRGEDQNDGGHFIISAEDNPTVGAPWADYYEGSVYSECDDFGVNEIINEILARHRLYAEWYNPGFLVVHDD